MRKVYFVLFLAIIVTAAFLYSSKKTFDYTETASNVLFNLKRLEKNEFRLESEILKSKFFLYYDYNKIYQPILEIKSIIKQLKNGHLKNKIHKNTYILLEKYEDKIHEKENDIFKFETLNSAIKNSQIYIPELSLKYLQLNSNLDISYYLLVNKAVSTIFLLQNSMDMNFISDLKIYYEMLKNYNLEDNPELEQFHKTFLLHLRVILKNFPIYQQEFKKLIDNKEDLKLLSQMRSSFLKESQTEARTIITFNFGIGVVFLSVLAYLAFLLVKLDINNETLKALKEDLSKRLITDDLTGLPNRKAFFEAKQNYKEPTFILINIDNFKHINDLYGSSTGDQLLIELGQFIKDKVEKLNAKVFRLGADDFGVLFEDRKDELEKIVETLIQEIENNAFLLKIKKNNKVILLEISINVSAGVSFISPLLETADMVLKHAKENRKKYLIYREDMQLYKHIQQNLNLIDTIKNALQNRKVFLVYQPILDNRTGNIVEYECLVRIEDQNGNIISPAQFLPVAKESKYYSQITKEVIKQAFNQFKNTSVMFSINLSAEDIIDKGIKEYIYEMLKKHPEIAERLTFEILESESIHNYEEVQEFIKNVKAAGVRIAIDDFGSGYSNFARIVELDPDFIKIDGSLIKKLPYDIYVQIVVSTIVDFSRKLGIKTVAEFVYNEDVFSTVKSMGIDYSQGYYIGKPSQECCPPEKSS
ncbi:EAL domain-containing protein [Persephonella sp. KM09-Lau-8]|uniref:EAL domain-containing protein n=1 Tax=Persephonella sp. KM09-Lau-8 TaxID=1158345 RepID=UPI00068FACEB|nr:EAL domain-containing protein [Persephonella sp. KM09-Lau-8]